MPDTGRERAELKPPQRREGHVDKESEGVQRAMAPSEHPDLELTRSRRLPSSSLRLLVQVERKRERRNGYGEVYGADMSRGKDYWRKDIRG